MSAPRCRLCNPQSPSTDCYICHGTGYDTIGLDRPFCPWCGEVLIPTAPFGQAGWNQKCQECGRSVEVKAAYTVVYTTSRQQKGSKRAK